LRQGIPTRNPDSQTHLSTGERKIEQQQHQRADNRLADQWYTLEKEIQTCEGCQLSAQRNRAVPGEGSRNAVVMFVGEGPGSKEDQEGYPFIGRSGKFLTKMLKTIDIRREDVYITNVVKCRPPENRDPRPAELASCADYLERQIELIDPYIIVTLGRLSMQRWFPGEKITQIHGQVREIGKGRVALPMFHPAAALRNPKWRAAFEEDLRRLPDLIQRAQCACRDND